MSDQEPTPTIPKPTAEAVEAVVETPAAAETVEAVVEAPAAAPAAAIPPPPPAMVVPQATAGVQVFPDGKPMFTATGEPASTKSRMVAALLCFFLGGIGIHRFYVGKVGTGILMIITLGGLGVWVLIDFIMILVGAFRDIDRKVLSNW